VRRIQIIDLDYEEEPDAQQRRSMT
jgi:hypothetical protein